MAAPLRHKGNEYPNWVEDTEKDARMLRERYLKVAQRNIYVALVTEKRPVAERIKPPPRRLI